MNEWSAEAWRAIMDAAPEGIVVCDAKDADHPVVYANPAFGSLCGYPPSVLIGMNLRILQGTDRDQEGRARLRDALKRGEPCRVLIRNYRLDGLIFWNEVALQPVRDASGTLTHWISYHRDASERLKGGEQRVTSGLPAWMSEDRLTGLHSRAYFEEHLRRDWQLAQRESHEIALVLFDIDDLAAYNDTFNKAAGDACIRRVARVVSACYRRGSDLIGRWEGGTLAVLLQGEAAARSTVHAQLVMQRVHDLRIHSPHASHERYVTLSAGVASLVPPRDLKVEALINAGLAALRNAKSRGKNTLVCAEAADFGRPWIPTDSRRQS